MQEPTDEMLDNVMQRVAESARESSMRARAELDRRMQETINRITERKKKVHSSIA